MEQQLAKYGIKIVVLTDIYVSVVSPSCSSCIKVSLEMKERHLTIFCFFMCPKTQFTLNSNKRDAFLEEATKKRSNSNVLLLAKIRLFTHLD